MKASDFQVRRATIDDLSSLKELWGRMQLPVSEMEKRLTEFQVVLTPEGSIAGAVGMEILDRQGRIREEAFDDFAVADLSRQQLWERLQNVAKNHGLFRLWTQESAPFWRQNGFLPPDEKAAQRFPAAWTTPSNWLTLALGENPEAEESWDSHFAQFKELERRQTQKTVRWAQALKFLVPPWRSSSRYSSPSTPSSPCATIPTGSGPALE